MKTKENPMNSEAAGWAAKIRAAEKAYADYYELVDETRRRYKNRRGGAGGGMTSGAAFNVFWSGIETQKPFLYFKQPRPCIDRLNKTGKPAEAMACRILERALEWNLGKFDFDSAAKYARNDFLISGCGILWEQYRPELVSVASDEGGEVEIKTGETVVSEYVDPKNFLADTQAGIWEEVSWIAKKMNIGLKEAVIAFGEKALLRELADKPAGGQICVYEIWDKSERRVMWLSCRGEPHFLKTADDPLGLSGFFPCPKPVFASQTNDSLIPEPDYVMIKPDLEELSGVIERMNLTIKALKVTGAYDSSFANLGDILNKDVALVSMADFDRLKSAGGLRGVIDFMPIEQYITALESLARRRDDIIQNIYRVTGISDIMRGSSTPSDTATAVRQKTSFGTLRNQDRQNDMQRFICDLYRLKAEIICEQFSTETLLRFLTPEEAADGQTVRQAMALLKKERMREMVLSVETDAVFNQEEEAARNLQAVQSIAGLVSGAFQLVSVQPALLPLYRQMIETVAATTARARPFESVIGRVFAKIEDELGRPEPTLQPKPQGPTTEEQIEMMKVRNDYEIDKEKNVLKAGELALKAIKEAQKS